MGPSPMPLSVGGSGDGAATGLPPGAEDTAGSAGRVAVVERAAGADAAALPAAVGCGRVGVVVGRADAAVAAGGAAEGSAAGVLCGDDRAERLAAARGGGAIEGGLPAPKAQPSIDPGAGS